MRRIKLSKDAPQDSTSKIWILITSDFLFYLSLHFFFWQKFVFLSDTLHLAVPITECPSSSIDIWSKAWPLEILLPV